MDRWFRSPGRRLFERRRKSRSGGAHPASFGKLIWRSEGHSNLNPILKALSSMRKNGVRCLLMGGQACVFYGAAEFSRDLDLVILPGDANLERLRSALAELEALPTAVPSLEKDALLRGHAVHFRCQRPDVSGLRIDVMSRLRGVPSFERLWERRTTIEAKGETVDLVSLPDLVLAKKTQRDRDCDPKPRRAARGGRYKRRCAPTRPLSSHALKPSSKPNAPPAGSTGSRW